MEAANIMRLEGDKPVSVTMAQHSGGEMFMAWVPYLLLVVFVLVWGERDIKPAINRLDRQPAGRRRSRCTRRMLNRLMVPGLHNLITRIPPVVAKPAPYAALYELNWLSASGTACFLAILADRAGAARPAAQGRQDLRRHVQAAEVRDPDHRVDAWPGVSDELLGHDLHAGPGAGGERLGVPVLQRRASAGWGCS